MVFIKRGNRKNKENEGYAAIWVLLVLALLTILVTAAELGGGQKEDKDPALWWFLAIALAILLFGLYVEAKRNLYAVCMFVLPFSLITLLIAVIVVHASIEPSPTAVGLGILMALTSAASTTYLIKSQFGKDSIPNILLRDYSRSQIYEIDGIQFVPLQSHKTITAGSILALKFVLQNCWDRERKFSLKLKPHKSNSFSNNQLHFPDETTVLIPGSTVGILTIPIEVDPDAVGKQALSASPTVTGSGGKRVRRWRAQGMSTEIPVWLSVAMLFTGIIAWGGGLQFQVKVLKSRHPAVDNNEQNLNPGYWETLWEPEPSYEDHYRSRYLK